MYFNPSLVGHRLSRLSHLQGSVSFSAGQREKNCNISETFMSGSGRNEAESTGKIT